jgi:prepilin-type N-terminal cleavage/methylation domain-containing protein
MKMSALRRAQKGFTLTEIAIVLGVIGLILGSIWVAASSVYNNQKNGKATQQLLAVSQSVRSLYATATTIGDAAGTDETATYIAAKVFPADMVNAAGTATVNPWNGTVMVTSQTLASAGDMFGIELNGVPTSACINLLTANTGTGRDTGLYYASASATAKGAAAYGATATTFPVTAATAAGATVCGAAATVSVQFVFKLKG